jgi:peptidoglycan biosynthesis protein MviN/MurJ (putative lipid II flippase)
MLVAYFVADLFKIAAAKRLKNKLTPKRIFKTKKIKRLGSLLIPTLKRV